MKPILELETANLIFAWLASLLLFNNNCPAFCLLRYWGCAATHLFLRHSVCLLVGWKRRMRSVVVVMWRLLWLLSVCRPVHQTLSRSLTTSYLTILMKAITCAILCNQSAHNIFVVLNSSELFERWSRGLHLAYTILNYSEDRLSRLSFNFNGSSAFGSHALVTLVEVTRGLLLYSTSGCSAYNSRFC